MVTYNIGGRDYPLALTLGAMSELDTLCGGFEHASAAFDGKSTMQIIDTAVKMLSILLRGGYDHCRELGEEPIKPPSEAALRVLLLPRDITPIKEAIFRSMAESMQRTVDVEPEKNAEATQGEA